jgi:putative SOS response-associated peptidase YedK
MCGRFVAASDPDGLVRFFVVDERKDGDLPPSWNVAPTETVRAVVEHDHRRYLVGFTWGLVPRWAGDRRGGAKMINARSETAADKPAYREAFRRRRCLVPADGFYEWQELASGAKAPHFVHPTEDPVFAFAGLWEAWRDPADPDAPPLRTCTILTRPADPRLADLHARMPLALPRAAWDTWLDRGLSDPHLLRDLLASAEPPAFAHHQVSEAVNTPRNNHPQLVLPVSP